MSSDLPVGWQAATWGDLATLEYGRALKQPKTQNGPVVVFGTNGPTGRTTVALSNDPTVIVGRKGAYRGIHWAAGPFWVIDTAFYLRPDRNLVEPRWAYYELLTHDINAMDSGSAIPSTSREDFYALPVKLPPLLEQRRIVSVLQSLDDKIDSNQRVCDIESDLLLMRFRRAVSMAQDRQPLANIAYEAKQRLQPSTTPDEVFEQFSIPAFDRAQGPDVCSGADMASAKTLLPDGPVVLVSKLNPARRRVWWPERLGLGIGVCSPEFVALTPRDPRDAAWLYGCVAYDDTFYGQVLSAVNGTTGSRQRVKPHDVLEATIPVPNAARRAEWEALAGPMLSQRVRLLRESRTLAAIRDALLPKLVSGQIRVPLSNDPEEQVGAAVEALGADAGESAVTAPA